MEIQVATKDDLIDAIENEAKIKVEGLVESAIEEAEEVHSGVKREDGISSFLETHIFPVTIDVIRHYRSSNKFLTILQIASALLHDVMEDNERILDLYASKSYGFDAYFRHRFGDYVYNVATILKIKPLGDYKDYDEKAREFERFKDYCNQLLKSDYDVKAIKLADRINNMNFIANVPGHEKITRYLREAEDFYLAFALIPPRADDFYIRLRNAYDDLRRINYKNEELVTN
ncbi:MAG: HD domain-containing protein [Candidatus Nitrosotenuis sp.]